jgi:hypothetical protein
VLTKNVHVHIPAADRGIFLTCKRRRPPIGRRARSPHNAMRVGHGPSICKSPVGGAGRPTVNHTGDDPQPHRQTGTEAAGDKPC